MDEPLQGIIEHIIDAGTVTQVVIRTPAGELRWLAADSNMLRRSQAALGKASLGGLRIEYAETEWPGGLAWFAVIEDEHVVCPNCRKHIPPHLNPDYCVFARHPCKVLKPTNGVHADD